VLQGKEPVTPFEKRLAQPVADTDNNTDADAADDEDAVMDLKGSSSDSSGGSGDEQGDVSHSTKGSMKVRANSHDNSGASSDNGSNCGIHFSDSTVQVRHYIKH
jgi:hypothetical protein